MKKQIILIAFFILSCRIYSQNVFFKILGSDTISIYGLNFIISGDNSFIVAGNKVDRIEELGYAHLSEYNQFGELIAENNYSLTDSFMVYCDIVKTDHNSFWVYAYIDDFETGTRTVHEFREYDEDLNLIRKFRAALPDSLNKPEQNFTIWSYLRYSDNRLIWHDMCMGKTYGYRFIYTFNNEGDSLDFIVWGNEMFDMKFYNESTVYSTGRFPGVMQSVNKMGFPGFAIDSLFDTNNIPGLYNGHIDDVKTYIDILSDTTIVFSALDLLGQANISILDTGLNLIKNVSFGTESTKYPAMRNGIGVSNDHKIFIAHDLWGDGWLLTKLDDNLNILWEKIVPIENNVSLQSILPTSDGGCLLLGLCYEFNSLNAVIVKTDANGDYNGIKDLQDKNGSTELIVYPNPGSSCINIETTEQNLNGIFSIYDCSGKPVLQRKLVNRTSNFDCRYLKSGVYFYDYILNGSRMGSGVWIKD